jgi:hypothetical protein
MTDDASAARRFLAEEEVFRDLEARATEGHFAHIRASMFASRSATSRGNADTAGPACRTRQRIETRSVDDCSLSRWKPIGTSNDDTAASWIY